MAVISVPTDHYRNALVGIDGAEVLLWDMAEPHPRQSEIQFAVPPYESIVRVLKHLDDLPALQVLQLLFAGYDNISPHVAPDVTLCNAAGVHDTATAEMAVALTLASLRHFPEFVVAQQNRAWLAPVIWPGLADLRVMILGYGRIGQAIARRLDGFEVELIGVATRARTLDEGPIRAVHGMDELPELLPHTDVVIAIVPLMESTKGLIDAAFLAQLPDGATVVNVARGPVIDAEALIAECKTGRLRAGLDVTDPEPLPADHPLWSTPGVFISHHTGGATTAFKPRSTRMLVEQVTRFTNGEPLENVVAGPHR